MKSIKKALLLILSVLVIAGSITVPAGADQTTDLKDLKIYAVDTTGAKKKVKLKFKSNKYTYDIKVNSDVASIEIVGTPSVNTSKVLVEKQGINTKMDFGKNLTIVDVTSATGQIGKYTINTTKLTKDQEKKTKKTSEKSKKSVKKADKNTGIVKVGKEKYVILKNFEKKYVPTGFEKTTAKYNGKEYACIRGIEKDITAFFLKGKVNGFYIYNSSSKKFYKMMNVKIHSRLFTIVKPKKTDDILDSYETKKIKIDDKDVKVWVLDADNEMYLVYAMNWDGEEALYQYDNKEKALQRYIVSADAGSQVKAANEAYDVLHNRYNKLVDKYNFLIKALCILLLVLVILVFIVINMRINKKERILKAAESEIEKYKAAGAIGAEKSVDNTEKTVDEDIKEPEDETEEVLEETDETETEASDAESVLQDDGTNNNYDEDNFFIDITGMTEDDESQENAEDDLEKTEAIDTENDVLEETDDAETAEVVETETEENQENTETEVEAEVEAEAEPEVKEQTEQEAEEETPSDEAVAQVDFTDESESDVAVTTNEPESQEEVKQPTKAEIKAAKKAEKAAIKAAKKAEKAAAKAAKKNKSNEKPEMEGKMEEDEFIVNTPDNGYTTDASDSSDEAFDDEVYNTQNSENIGETIKSMLPDDDEDFEFIDLE